MGTSSTASSTASSSLDIHSLLSMASGLSMNNVTIRGGLHIDSISAASEDDMVAFMSDTVFFGRPYLNSDSGGFAKISKGERSIDVVFDKEYVTEPVVNVTITLEDATSSTTNADAIFADNIQYLVRSKSTKGFTILINKAAPTDITFSWTALAIKDAKTFTLRTPVATDNPTTPDNAPSVVPEVNSTSTDDQNSSSTSSTTENISPLNTTSTSNSLENDTSSVPVVNVNSTNTQNPPSETSTTENSSSPDTSSSTGDAPPPTPDSSIPSAPSNPVQASSS